MKSFPIFIALVAAVSTVLAQADNTLTVEEKAAGWKLLFDGKALTGLRGVQKSDPLKAGWIIENGELNLPKDFDKMGRVTGGDLMTVEAFTDFEFSFEWRIGVSTNAGVRYLVRAGLGGSPAGHEYQIIDDVRHPEGMKGGPIRRTGALDGVLPPSDGKRLHDAERWNASRIVVHGNRVEHWLNGLMVLEYELNSRPLGEAMKAAKVRLPQGFGTKTKSPLVLVDQGDEIAFRNLKVRALLPAPPPGPATPRAVLPVPPSATPPANVRPPGAAPTPYARPLAPPATPVPARPAAPPAGRPLTPPTLE